MKRVGGAISETYFFVTFADVVVRPTLILIGRVAPRWYQEIQLIHTMASFVEADSLTSTDREELHTPFNESLACMTTIEEFSPQLSG